MDQTAETIPAPPDTFANPFILCVECQQRVTNVRYPGAINVPCGHTGTHDACPSWGPADGCTCTAPHGPAVLGDIEPGYGLDGETS